MKLPYLHEHVQPTLLALDLADKEAAHLRYSLTSLFALPIDLAWVRDLGNKPELAEKVEAFVSRFGRLQDHLGEKLLPRLAALMGENSKTLIDTLAIAEKAGWLASANDFVTARRLRNALVHEYMHDAQVFLESLLTAPQAGQVLFDTIQNVHNQLNTLGLVPPQVICMPETLGNTPPIARPAHK